MATDDRKALRRIMLALNESSSLPTLWRAVTELLGEGAAELVTVFITDDRWHRAASLPFTREISRFSGLPGDFTRERADEVNRDAQGRTQKAVAQLAAERQLDFVFEILAEHSAEQIHRLVRMEQDILIAPSLFRSRPIFAELSRLKCRVLLVDTEE